MQVVGKRYYAVSTYEQRLRLKAVGFRWDPARKQWYTEDKLVADSLNDEGAAAKRVAAIEEKARQASAAIESSRISSMDIDLPRPEGLDYLPYQKAGIHISLPRPAVLLADEMGLGKTIQVIGIVNCDETLRNILVICPASLKLNWRKELTKWLIRDYTICIAEGSSCHVGWKTDEAHGSITIVNYDILQRHKEKLRAFQWDAVFVDEAHYLKNPKALRTQVVFGIEPRPRAGVAGVPGITAKRKGALTGTPIPSRPIEGWGLFHWLDPVTFSSFWQYTKRYCAAENNGYGYDMKGASNLGELQDKLRSSIMIRRLKKDVLKDLPPKRRQVVEFEDTSGLVEEENRECEAREERLKSLRVAAELAKASEYLSDYEAAVEALRAAASTAFTELSKLRHATAMATVPHALKHIEDALSEEGHKVVIFAHHEDVVDALLGWLKENGMQPVAITGKTPTCNRQSIVEEFQGNSACRAFVGNIQAAGVGLTLTSSDHVIFVELDWVPGNMTQAEDRCHRIGQLNSVLVQHLVIDGSMAARMAKVLVEKQTVIDAALDSEKGSLGSEPLLPVRDVAATQSITRRQVAEKAVEVSPAQQSAVLTALRQLASMDGDRARERNGAGFSRIDVAIGHSLVQCVRLSPKQTVLGMKIVNKYRRQLSEVLVRDCKG